MDTLHQFSVLSQFCLEQAKEIEDQKFQIYELRTEIMRLQKALSEVTFSPNGPLSHRKHSMQSQHEGATAVSYYHCEDPPEDEENEEEEEMEEHPRSMVFDDDNVFDNEGSGGTVERFSTNVAFDNEDSHRSNSDWPFRVDNRNHDHERSGEENERGVEEKSNFDGNLGMSGMGKQTKEGAVDKSLKIQSPNGVGTVAVRGLATRLSRDKLVPVPLSPTSTLISFEYRESSHGRTRLMN